MKTAEQKEKHRLNMIQYRKDNKEKQQDYDKKKSVGRKIQYHLDSNLRKKIRDRTREYRSQEHVKEKMRAARLLKTYGITLDDYNEMFVEQQGCCKICGTSQSELKHNLSVDHCHITGKVRGLLCNDCNLILGNAYDSIDILQSAIKYLKKIPLISK